MRPLTDHWFDEACLTQMSANPLSSSPTMPCLFSEQPGAKAAAEQLTHPAAIEDIIQIILFMVPYFLLFGQEYSNTQATFTCLLFLSQPVLASQEDVNARPGYYELLSLILAIVLLYWASIRLLNLIDAHTVSLMKDTDDEESDSEAAAEDEGDDGPDGDVDEVEDEEDKD